MGNAQLQEESIGERDPRIPAHDPTGSASKLRERPRLCPVFVAQKSRNFRMHVDSYPFNPRALTLVQAFDFMLEQRWVPATHKNCLQEAVRCQRKDEATFLKHMLFLFMTNIYYERMNLILRTCDDLGLEKLAPVIFYTREAFRSDRGFLQPFDGEVIRGLQLSDEQLLMFTPDREWFWPAFTSSTINSALGEWFANNLHSGAFGTSVQLSIRCNGQAYRKESKTHARRAAAEVEAKTGSHFVPCVVQPHTFNDKSTAEVVFPPFTKFRTVNLNAQQRPVKIWLESMEFPSVWESIENLDDESFQAFAERNPDVVAAHGCNRSLMNWLAQRVAQEAEKGPAAKADHPCERAGAMFVECARRGANLNEVDEEDGLVPLYRIARVAAKKDGSTARTALQGIAAKMMECGASPNVPLDRAGGKTVRELFGQHVPAVNQGTNLLPHVWQYWLADGIAGKSIGWHDYAADATPEVDGAFALWSSSGAVGSLLVKSGRCSHAFDFVNMRRRNVRTGRVRPIRRVVHR